MNLESKDKASSSFQKDLVWRFSGLKYMMRLIDHYGIDIVKKRKNCYFSRTKTRNAFELAGIIQKKTGILLLRKQEGDQPKWDVDQRKKLSLIKRTKKIWLSTSNRRRVFIKLLV